MADDFEKDRNNESEEFRRYREQMHGVEYEDEDKRRPQPLRLVYGIFMILIYIGMGVLCLINFFGAPETGGWILANHVVGVMLIIYGFWRGYRLYAGID